MPGAPNRAIEIPTLLVGFGTTSHRSNLELRQLHQRRLQPKGGAALI